MCEAGAPSKCVAGRYEGSFDMSYRSTPSGFCGIVAQLDEGRARGAWNFDLTSQGGEFSFIVKTGCLTGAAEEPDAGVEKAVPLHAILEGSVDCNTGELTGRVKGTYRATSVCNLGQHVDDYFYMGSMSGTFDPETNSFINTKVEFAEPPVLLGEQPGGRGTWSATLVPNAPVVTAPVDCLDGVVFRDDLFPDAGI